MMMQDQMDQMDLVDQLHLSPLVDPVDLEDQLRLHHLVLVVLVDQ
jgi:hypothetical protein